MTKGAEWFTQVRVRRLAKILGCLPVRGHRPEERALAIWRNCGGPIGEAHDLLAVLLELNLVEVRTEELRRTRSGQSVNRAASKGDLRDLGKSLIRAGRFHDQARRLLESGEFEESGSLKCSARDARRLAAQLVGLLSYWPGVVRKAEVVIPRDVLAELESVWALLPPVEIPEWARARKEVGNRAEMYTVQFERSRGVGTAVVWVSRDDDGLGYDVEDRSRRPTRCIEVKGRRDSKVIFFLSDNEWRQAERLAEHYEVQFWGGIDLNRDPAVEYAALRAEGYPLVYERFFDRAKDEFEVQAVQWRFELIAE